jgi:multisubunit Na+/H+ antiporter MnhG subunit
MVGRVLGHLVAHVDRRDTFWTPAHLFIQAGGLIAGLSSGYVALHTTFRGTEAERAATVSFWGFRAPLGAWICIWGCGAMLTSAPFDNWWHNAYGLDVRIISPPHAVLALGIFAICVGAMLLTLAQQNRADDAMRRRLAWVLAGAGGLFIMNFALFLTEYSERRMMHSAFFYQVVAVVFPFALTAMSRAIKLRGRRPRHSPPTRRSCCC